MSNLRCAFACVDVKNAQAPCACHLLISIEINHLRHAMRPTRSGWGKLDGFGEIPKELRERYYTSHYHETDECKHAHRQRAPLADYILCSRASVHLSCGIWESNKLHTANTASQPAISKTRKRVELLQQGESSTTNTRQHARKQQYIRWVYLLNNERNPIKTLHPGPTIGPPISNMDVLNSTTCCFASVPHNV